MDRQRKLKAGVLVLAALLTSCVWERREQNRERATMAVPRIEDAGAASVPGFDDALADIVASLEAAPGKTDTYRWNPGAAGSVRLVGTVQKLSPETAAELRVTVDGQLLWRRQFGRGDVIPHGVDILACDLTPTSTVAVIAGAENGAADIRAALQVVPEPYVSRWRPDLPTGFPEFTVDRAAVLRREGQEILEKLRTASANGAGRFVIPPGDYLFHANWSHASTLKELVDLEIVAEDVTFWFEPPMVHALLFEDCRNVTVHGLTIDFTQPCWFQARITDVDRENQTLHAALMAGYEPRNANGEPETEGSRTFMFYDAAGGFINHRHTPGSWQLNEDGMTVLCRDFKRHDIPAAVRPGDYVAATIRTGAALRSRNCSGMRFEDVNIWSSPGMAAWEGGGEGGHVYYRVRATRRPHTNRLQAFGADIFHLAGADRGPTLDRCELAYGADDNLNIHGSFGRVVQRAGDRRYYLQGAYDVGDTLEFRDMKSVDLLGIANAIAVEATPDGPDVPINDRYDAKGEFVVELDRPLDLPPLALVVLDGKRSAAGWVVRNCWLHDNFQRTLINGAPGGLIENTTLQNVGHGVCIQFETWGPWMEGPFARNLTIRNNRFLDAPPEGPVINVSMHPPGGGSNRRRFDTRPVTDMTITGNCISRTDGVPISIHNVDGLRIHGNSIDWASASGTPESREWLYLQDCNDVSVRDNVTPGP